jgi:hypothetical protein
MGEYSILRIMCQEVFDNTIGLYAETRLLNADLLY